MKSNRRDFLRKTGLVSLGLTGLGFTGTSPVKAKRTPEQVAGDLKLLDWEPIPQLVVEETIIKKPKFPVIDIHNHLRNLDKTDEYLKAMDEAGVWKVVSLDGRSEDDFYKEHLEVSNSVAEDRFIIFYRIDYSRIDEPNYGEDEADRLEQAVKAGLRGIKVSKSLGLRYRDASGELLRVDDPRLDPVWARAGELGIPVLMHISDPKAFFTPIDRYNERYDELGAHPDWGFAGPEYPEKEELLRQRNRVFEKHPNTTFIATHMANLPEELGRVSMWLEKYPNMYVDIDARISELGRQPYTARKFMIKHQDRVLFGTDTAPNVESYQVYYRFLETDDEYINADPSHHRQGRWRIYGVYLPDDVLEKIYNKNALKIFEEFKG